MAEIKYIDENGLLYYDQKNKARLAEKVDKEKKTGKENEYKVLSDNNLSDELLKKINDAGDGNFENLTNKPAIDGKSLSSTSTAEDLGLAKKSDIPTDYVSNDALSKKGFATETYVNSQVANLNKKQIVTSTEEMTEENIIYLLANSGSKNNSYDEYIVVEGNPEKIGTTDVDLTGYLKDSDFVAITNQQIDEIVNS